MILQEKLNNYKAEKMLNRPNNIQQIMVKESNRVNDLSLLDSTPKVGEELENFNLINALENNVELTELLYDGPIVITFYRGGWCPYCNLELQSYQDSLPQIKALGATLVAITPELPDASLSTTEKNNLEFEVLTDLNSDYSHQIGLAYTLSPEIIDLYNLNGLDVAKHNGENQFDIPLAATLIVDTDRIIKYAFVDTDYTVRAEPTEVIQALKKILNK